MRLSYQSTPLERVTSIAGIFILYHNHVESPFTESQAVRSQCYGMLENILYYTININIDTVLYRVKPKRFILYTRKHVNVFCTHRPWTTVHSLQKRSVFFRYQWRTKSLIIGGRGVNKFMVLIKDNYDTLKKLNSRGSNTS